MVSTKKGRSCHSTCYLNTLLVETISTRSYWLTCRNQKLAQNKPLQQRLFDLILGFWQCFFYILIANMNGGSDPNRVCYFLRDCVIKTRSIYVNCFNTLRFLTEVSKKLQKMHFLDNLRTVTQEGSTETRQMTPFLSTFPALNVCNIHFYIWKWSTFIFLWSPFGLFWSVKYLNFEQKLPIQRVIIFL